MATFPRRQPPPKKGRKDYHVYRQEVREDFNGYCSYCGVHESDWSHNEKNYHLDHFKPQAQFDDLDDSKDNFYNLRWCCHICNRRDAKGDKWPSPEEEAQGKGFVDLCEDDWQDHYDILPDGKLHALSAKAFYTIEAIGLNGEDYVKQRLEIFQKGGSLWN